MEVNKAPEKIYINSNLENRTWLIGKGDSSFIEYSRTDAFVKKAEKFMNTVNEYLYHCISEECDYVDTDKFIENFRKYMEGE